VDYTSRDEEIVSWLDLDPFASDRPSDDALKTVYRFFPVTVMVRDWHTRVWRDHHLKHIKCSAGVILSAQKPQLHCAYLDEFSHGLTFRSLETTSRTSRDGCTSSEPNYRQELMTEPWGVH
jgi:hypothetical protein